MAPRHPLRLETRRNCLLRGADLLGLPTILLAAGLVYLTAQARPLNLLLFGDETATSMGVPPDRLRRILFVVFALVLRSGLRGSDHAR